MARMGMPMSPWPPLWSGTDGSCWSRKRADEGAVINQPAGHLDPANPWSRRRCREVLEETGCEVELEGLLGIAQYTAPANGVTYMRTTFYGRVTG